MAKKPQPVRTWDQIVALLPQQGFAVQPVPGAAGGIVVGKHGCAAAIARGDGDGVRLLAKPGCLVAGEIARIVDKGYQKFLRTPKIEVPATAEHLKNLHRFTEELKEVTSSTSLYNESLGTVSDRYLYDRVQDRDLPQEERPKRPWQDETTPSSADKPGRS